MARHVVGARHGQSSNARRAGEERVERAEMPTTTPDITTHSFHCERCAVLADRCRLELMPRECAAGTGRCVVALCREVVAAPDGASSISFVRDTSIFGPKARY